MAKSSDRFRRITLQLLVWVALVFTAGCSNNASPLDDSGAEQADVVIVGAGMSGLVAARALHDQGLRVIVLEARERIGGRTYTTMIDGAPIDLGAGWIHGPQNNPLATLVDSLGFARYAHEVDPSLTYDAVGQAALTPAMVTSHFNAVETFADAKASLLSELGESASVAEAVNHFIEDEGYTGSNERGVRYAIEQDAVELDTAGPADTTSLQWFYEEEEFAGGDQVIEGGFVRVIDALAQPLDIRLSHTVDRIQYDGTGVVVHAGERAFAADYGIVTVPLGVLKAGSIAFEPQLPDDKITAIDRLDMGNLEKVVLRFTEAFWPQGGVTYIGQPLGELPLFADMSAPAGSPTLVVFHGGRGARDALEAYSDSELIDEALGHLAQALGMTIPTPTATHVTRWTQDPLSGGSYSYVPVGADYDDMDRLGAPVERLQFAGEATIRGYFQTAHGALMSGLREAQRIEPNAGLNL